MRSEREPSSSHAELLALIAEVRRIEVQSRRLAQSVMAGGYHSVFRGAGVEFEEVREYVEGDDPRAIDWNVTARVGRPFIKKYVDERQRVLAFLLDLSPSMRGGFAAWSSRDVAARLIACLALSAVSHDDKVALLGFGSEVVHHVPPRRGQGHALRIVRDSLALATAPGLGDPEPALIAASRVLRRRSVVFLVSDFLFDSPARVAGAPLPFAAALRRCARRHDLIAVRITPPEALAPPAVRMTVRDPEGGGARRVDFAARGVRESFVTRAAAWRRDVDAELARAGVNVVDVAVPQFADVDAVSRPILQFFAMRERRGEKR
jgi:uncharacterized protein (DUF58 family)